MDSLLHGCSALLPAWLCGHAGIIVYLIPSAALAFLLWMASGAHPFFFLFTAAGTLSHELAHFIVGLLVGAEPNRITIIPKRRGKVWELGSVVFNNLSWYNAAPAALAPLLVLGVPLAVAWYRTRHGLQFGPLDLALTLLLAPQFLSFWPSPVDWKLAWRSWPWLVIIAVVTGFAVHYRESMFQFVKP